MPIWLDASHFVITATIALRTAPEAALPRGAVATVRSMPAWSRVSLGYPMRPSAGAVSVNQPPMTGIQPAKTTIPVATSDAPMTISTGRR